MNVQRMRRANQRGLAVHHRLERETRLARMTPKHRARHERTDWLGGTCLECAQISWARGLVDRAMAVHLAGW